jgi:predicted esterase
MIFVCHGYPNGDDEDDMLSHAIKSATPFPLLLTARGPYSRQYDGYTKYTRVPIPSGSIVYMTTTHKAAAALTNHSGTWECSRRASPIAYRPPPNKNSS